MPMVRILMANPSGKLTLNICASLTQQLKKLDEAGEFFQGVRALVKKGQVELIGSAAYHPLLTQLPSEEIIRQIELNHKINQLAFGTGYRPKGFFPPEMVYNREITQIVEQLGFQWIILDESAHPLASVHTHADLPHEGLKIDQLVYQIRNSGLKIFFRDRELSLHVAFSQELILKDFLTKLIKSRSQAEYILLAMDGETFGHYSPSLMSFFEELMIQNQIELTTVTELIFQGYPLGRIEPMESAWGITLEDANQQRTFPRWKNPQNPIHQLQWQLYNLALESIRKRPEIGFTSSEKKEKWLKARHNLDKGLHSDQFWWAGRNPCWYLEMIQRGAKLLKDSIILNPYSSQFDHNQARYLYHQVIEKGKELYGEEIIMC